MKVSTIDLHSERGSAGTKFLIILVLIVLLANAGYNYVPVAYQGASLKQEMDTAVVKGLAAAGRMHPQEIVQAHVTRAMADYNTPPDAFVEIKSTGSFVQAHVSYRKEVDVLPFGLYRYNYDFDYTAVPSGYLLKDN